MGEAREGDEEAYRRSLKEGSEPSAHGSARLRRVFAESTGWLPPTGTLRRAIDTIGPQKGGSGEYIRLKTWLGRTIGTSVIGDGECAFHRAAMLGVLAYLTF